MGLILYPTNVERHEVSLKLFVNKINTSETKLAVKDYATPASYLFPINDRSQTRFEQTWTRFERTWTLDEVRAAPRKNVANRQFFSFWFLLYQSLRAAD